MNWQSIMRNWKTTLAGVITFLLSVPTFVTSIQAWAAHQPVDWRTLLINIAVAAGGVGLVAAKDSSNHSTIAEVEHATVVTPPAAAPVPKVP